MNRFDDAEEGSEDVIQNWQTSHCRLSSQILYHMLSEKLIAFHQITYMGVSTHPGNTDATLIPVPFTSKRRPSAIPVQAYFDAQ
jgi:hypothetical protein